MELKIGQVVSYEVKLERGLIQSPYYMEGVVISFDDETVVIQPTNFTSEYNRRLHVIERKQIKEIKEQR